jgi:sugar lactone lactonase YvrE
VPSVATSTWPSPVIAGAVGQIGHADGPGADARFCSPSGIAIDPQGNIFVADMGNNTIRKIAPDHTVTTLAGLAGAAGIVNVQGSAARFIAPQGIAVDQNDTVYVAEFVNNTVRKITSDGTVSLLAGSSTPGAENGRGAAAHFRNPWALAVDNSGNVYVSDNGNHAVRKISADGTVITLSDSFADPRGVGLDAMGNIYVADIAKGVIRKVSPLEKVNALPAALSAPENLAVDPQGLIYVTDADGIVKLSHGGKILRLPPLTLSENTSQFAHADAIALAADGTLYIADSANNVICKYVPPAH